MHAPGFPALSSVALAARGSSARAKRIATRAVGAAVSTSSSPSASRCCRRLHSSSPSPRPSNWPFPGKPGSESVFEDDADLEAPQTGAEAIGGRSRSSASASRRRSQSKRRIASDLPPVNLPYSFLENNVTYWGNEDQPKLPTAIRQDLHHPKVSRLYSNNKDDGPGGQKSMAAFEEYFETAVNLLLQRNQALMTDFLDRPVDGPSKWDHPDTIAYVVRTWDMVFDSAWHLADALYPARQPEYYYFSRPFWWWHIYKDFDPRTQSWRDPVGSREMPVRLQLNYSEAVDNSLAQTVGDFPVESFDALCKNIHRDMSYPPPTTFDPKTGKRPINILSISGYNGKAIAESVASHIGHFGCADVIHLDAHDLSSLLGEYIGQNLVYSRGALSTMGFRAAELNGKIYKEPEVTPKSHEDDGGDNDTNIINVRTSSSSWEDPLQKIKQGNFECFTDWENLKINKMLDSIINDTVAHRSGPVLIHVHDYVELSMTLEGSVILSKLRERIDAAWKRRRPIALFGTSSCDHPSEEYQNMIRELSATDLVVTRHIQPDRAESYTGLTVAADPAPFHLQRADTLSENARNINRMMDIIRPKFSWAHENRLDPFYHHPIFRATPMNLLCASVLPLPEIHNLARAFIDIEDRFPGRGSEGFLERIAMGPLRQAPGQDFFEDTSGEPQERRDQSKPGEEGKNESHGGVALVRTNEYEKRIASGIINRENLRTSFADVHVPTEIVGALKLLTSLALVRPDAFSYGVLAHDKINGCLLYGPPGTGKTMLAKAVAKESGANMLEISGASINDKWVGEAEKLIRAVFTLAKKLSPCVVFIDEADSLLANRSMFSSRASHREHINQFLKEWDGMEETNAFIMVATNRPFDLDDAVLRRLPRKLLVDLPLRDDRAAILRLLLRDEQLAPAISLEDLADRTPYYSGSDLKNVCVAAAMAAVEEENAAASAHQGPEPYEHPPRRTLQKEHFERALKQIPASISEDMVSLRLIRRFDEEYGNRRKGGGKKTMGFGGAEMETNVDVNPARVRQGGP